MAEQPDDIDTESIAVERQRSGRSPILRHRKLSSPPSPKTEEAESLSAGQSSSNGAATSMVPRVLLEDRQSPDGASDVSEWGPSGGYNDEHGTVLGKLLAAVDARRDAPVGAEETVEMDERVAEHALLLADDERSDDSDAADADTLFIIKPKLTTDESCWSIFLQVIVPFLVAGGGMVGAGLVLDEVQHWPVFTRVPELFILVPALLGLKGNLEMTLASRLSTLANLGRMDSPEEQWSVVTANLALIQAQAAVVAFLASLFAVTLAWVPKGVVDWNHALLLCASSLTTASLASLALGLIMVGVVVLSRRWDVNPDNVATPIAASLGDLITLSVLASFGSLFLRAKKDAPLLNLAVTVAFLSATALWVWLAAKNDGTRRVLRTGWSPVVFAMLISSGGGFILRFAVSRFHGIAVFQPVINGVGGNLVAVQASRISTSLHRLGAPGYLAGRAACHFLNPARAFCGSEIDSKAARVLLLIVVPGHLIFNYMIHFLQAGHTTITLTFTLVYMTAAVVQVGVLLFVCQWMVRAMWAAGVDPDNSAIPYLTALGDLLGTALLAAAFLLLFAVGDKDADIGE